MSKSAPGKCQTTTVISRQIEALRQERSRYVARVSELMRRPDRHAEVHAYLHLIDNINNACIKLARLAEYTPVETPVLPMSA